MSTTSPSSPPPSSSTSIWNSGEKRLKMSRTERILKRTEAAGNVSSIFQQAFNFPHISAASTTSPAAVEPEWLVQAWPGRRGTEACKGTRRPNRSFQKSPLPKGRFIATILVGKIYSSDWDSFARMRQREKEWCRLVRYPTEKLPLNSGI